MSNFALEPSTKFLDPDRILFGCGLSSGQTVVDLGTGSGFFSLSAAKIIGEQGLVYTIDILEPVLEHVAAEARLHGVKNIKTIHADLEKNNFGVAIPTGTVDLVILANINHQIKNQSGLWAESYRILKTGGKIVVVEWNDQPSPIGPLASDRIEPQKIKQLAKSSNLKEAGVVPTDAYHYGLVFIK